MRQKIDITLRDRLPIICRDEQIIYVPACAIADEANLKKQETAICVSIYKKTMN